MLCCTTPQQCWSAHSCEAAVLLSMLKIDMLAMGGAWVSPVCCGGQRQVHGAGCGHPKLYLRVYMGLGAAGRGITGSLPRATLHCCTALYASCAWHLHL